MRKIVLWAACLLLLPGLGRAQTSREAVQRFLVKMTAGSVHLSFRFTVDNAQKNTRDAQTGSLLYDGARYHLRLGDLDLYCDGTSKWVYSEAVDEVTVFTAADDVEMTDNPLTYLIINEDKFRYRPAKRLVQNGRPALSIDLIPQRKDAPYSLITLLLDEASFLPLQLTYKMKDGQCYIIDVDRLDTGVAVKASDFSFPAGRYPRATVNDLR
jgi:outer membrane lipoprotein-sorting protein